MQVPLAFLFGGSPGPAEMLIILGIGVLLFGKRLPEVGRSLGKGIVEFKKGINGVEDDAKSTPQTAPAKTEELAAPKFEAPIAEPQDEVASA